MRGTIVDSVMKVLNAVLCEPRHDKTSKMSVRPAKTLIRVFAVRMKIAWVLSYPLSAQRRLIWLGGCPGWSESSLGAHSVRWFCHVVAHLYRKACSAESWRLSRHCPHSGNNIIYCPPRKLWQTDYDYLRWIRKVRTCERQKKVEHQCKQHAYTFVTNTFF